MNSSKSGTQGDVRGLLHPFSFGYSHAPEERTLSCPSETNRQPSEHLGSACAGRYCEWLAMLLMRRWHQRYFWLPTLSSITAHSQVQRKHHSRGRYITALHNRIHHCRRGERSHPARCERGIRTAVIALCYSLCASPWSGAHPLLQMTR